MTPIPISDQVKEAEYELSMREKVYPDRVKAGRMTKAEMAKKINTMKAIIETLKKIEQERSGTQSSLF